MTCPQCHNTGLRHEGTGYRMRGYPYAERNTATECNCPAGDALVQERKDAYARWDAEYQSNEDYIQRKREEMRAAETERLIASGLRYCPKCDAEKSREGFNGFDICGDCLAACHVKGETE